MAYNIITVSMSIFQRDLTFDPEVHRSCPICDLTASYLEIILTSQQAYLIYMARFQGSSHEASLGHQVQSTIPALETPSNHGHR